MHAFDRQTDRQTDGRTDRRTEFPSLYRDCISCSAVKTMCVNFGKILGKGSIGIQVLVVDNFTDDHTW